MLRASKPCNMRVVGSQWIPKSRRGYDFLWDTKNAVDNGLIEEPGWFDPMNFHPPPPRYARTGLGKDLTKIRYHEDKLKEEYLASNINKSQLWINRAILGDLTWEKHPADVFAAKQQEFIDRGYPKHAAWKLADRDERMREMAFEMERDFATEQARFLGIPYVPESIHFREMSLKYEQMASRVRARERAKSREMLENLVQIKKDEGTEGTIPREALEKIRAVEIMDYLHLHPEDSNLFEFKDVFKFPEDPDEFVKDIRAGFEAESDIKEGFEVEDEKLMKGELEEGEEEMEEGFNEKLGEMEEIFDEGLKEKGDIEIKEFAGKTVKKMDKETTIRIINSFINDLKDVESMNSLGNETHGKITECIAYLNECIKMAEEGIQKGVLGMAEASVAKINEILGIIRKVPEEEADPDITNIEVGNVDDLFGLPVDNLHWKFRAHHEDLRALDIYEKHGMGKAREYMKPVQEIAIEHDMRISAEFYEEQADLVEGAEEEKWISENKSILKDLPIVKEDPVPQIKFKEDPVPRIKFKEDTVSQIRFKEDTEEDTEELNEELIEEGFDEEDLIFTSNVPLESSELNLRDSWRLHKYLGRPLTREEVENDMIFRKEMAIRFLNELGFEGAIQDDQNIEKLLDTIFEEEVGEVKLSREEREKIEFEKEIDQKLALEGVSVPQPSHELQSQKYPGWRDWEGVGDYCQYDLEEVEEVEESTDVPFEDESKGPVKI